MKSEDGCTTRWESILLMNIYEVYTEKCDGIYNDCYLLLFCFCFNKMLCRWRKNRRIKKKQKAHVNKLEMMKTKMRGK